MEPGLYLITDGACKNKTNFNAGSGIIIHKLNQDGTTATHKFMFYLEEYEVNNIEYQVLYPDSSLPEGKYKMNLIQNSDVFTYKIDEFMIFNISTTGKQIKRTNNRAEYFPYILGSMIASVMYPNETLTLISDSNLLVKTLNVWMDGWIKKGELHNYKNPDLLFQMAKLTKPKKTLHVYSHLSSPQIRRLSPEYQEYTKFNTEADSLANEAIAEFVSLKRAPFH